MYRSVTSFMILRLTVVRKACQAFIRTKGKILFPSLRPEQKKPRKPSLGACLPRRYEYKIHPQKIFLPLAKDRRPLDNGGMNDVILLKRNTLAQHLRRNIQGEVRFDLPSCRLYSTDASLYQIEPLGVVIPRTIEDVIVTVQIAGEMDVSITARGGGTSLSGQSIGPGVILDCSKYLNAILDIDPVSRVVRVQPGVVLDQLNRELTAHGLFFGPEVATSSRANLGGMIGNNSAEARSILYGKTGDHVRRLETVLSNGNKVNFGPASLADWDRKAELRSLEGEIYRGVRQVLRDNAEEIIRRFPRIPRRVSGYNLDGLVSGLTGRNPAGVGLHRADRRQRGNAGGSHRGGTEPDSTSQGSWTFGASLCHLANAMDALAVCLEAGPSAVELLDRQFIELARENLSLRDTMSWVQGRPEALFMVEFCGDDPHEVADRVARLQKRLAGVLGVTALVPALDPAIRDPLWALRSAAMPLLYGQPGDRKPVTFVEDPAVAPARLPEFVARFRELLHRHGTEGAFYGHASVGCLHIRPWLNLKDRADVARMRRIADEVSDLVLEFGGSMSGEHGDGLVRSEWNRKMFGPVVYDVFCPSSGSSIRRGF